MALDHSQPTNANPLVDATMPSSAQNLVVDELPKLLELWNLLATMDPGQGATRHGKGEALMLARRALGYSQLQVSQILFGNSADRPDPSLTRRVSYIESGTRLLTSDDEKKLADRDPVLFKEYKETGSRTFRDHDSVIRCKEVILAMVEARLDLVGDSTAKILLKMLKRGPK